MWDMGLGAWPCSAVLGRRLAEASPASSPPGDCHTARQQWHTMRGSGKLPMHHPISKLGQCQNRSAAPQQGIH